MGQRWEEVLDHQMDLWRFWKFDPRAKSIAEYYVGERAAMWATNPDVGEDMGKVGARTIGSMLAHLPEALYDAEPMWVDPDMMSLVETAAESFQPEPLLPQDLITTNGFCYLPRPLYMKDVRGKRVSVRAFCWEPHDVQMKGDVKPGISVHLFSSWNDADDYHHGPKPPLDLQLLHVTPWIFGLDYPAAGSGMTEVARIIQCLWRVATQTIADRSVNEATKPFRKRLIRGNFPYRKVTIIRLRRPDYIPSGGHNDVEWSHRWIVRPHWRSQYYPAMGIHRQVLIASYVKGPADKPLVVTKRAFELVQ